MPGDDSGLVIRPGDFHDVSKPDRGRLMLHKVETAPGQFETRTFTVMCVSPASARAASGTQQPARKTAGDGPTGTNTLTPRIQWQTSPRRRARDQPAAG